MWRSHRFAPVVLAVLAGLALVPAAQAQRLRGPGFAVTTVPAFGSVTYYDTFVGGQSARVRIVGDGATDLDVFVYDENNNLVAQGIGVTDVETVHWNPLWTGTFRIVVRNLGSTWNRYLLTTD